MSEEGRKLGSVEGVEELQRRLERIKLCVTLGVLSYLSASEGNLAKDIMTKLGIDLSALDNETEEERRRQALMKMVTIMSYIGMVAERGRHDDIVDGMDSGEYIGFALSNPGQSKEQAMAYFNALAGTVDNVRTLIPHLVDALSAAGTRKH